MRSSSPCAPDDPACSLGQPGGGGDIEAPDADGDRVGDADDNCPFDGNPDQADADGDGWGDACSTDADRDVDRDGVPDREDNCPLLANVDQIDRDGDGTGDACQPDAPAVDRDGDGVPDVDDNCPWVSNADQADADGDGRGDVCQDEVPPDDADGDGVPDSVDNCPALSNPAQTDADGDGMGDACQPDPVAPDADRDGIPDVDDNCPAVSNPGQADSDGDGQGDACEPQVQHPGEGTPEDPFVIVVEPDGPTYRDHRDTREATSRRFDQYPPNELNESGPEFVYRFDLAERCQVDAWIDAPEPEGTDVDVHLLASLEPLQLIERGHHSAAAVLDPGRYFLVLDTYATGGGPLAGPYSLHVQVRRWADGTPEDPIALGGQAGRPLELPFAYADARDTNDALSDRFDEYPPNGADESGPEFVYTFTVDEEVRLSAALRMPEPDGTDIDLHLLSSLEPLQLLARDNAGLFAVLQPGTYFLVADTFGARSGPYRLGVSIDRRDPGMEGYFNDYVLAAVDYLAANYRLLGYDSAVLTHDIEYGPYGTISRSRGARTMCVAAVLEVILTAMQLYVQDSGDQSVWDFLPKRSWERLGSDDIKAHLWVNHSLNSGGTGDALRNFGMGENVAFQELRPGGFVNLNRTNGTGHAVVFLAFIDIEGNESPVHHDGVVGFKYFSSQGGFAEGNGGLDFRYAVFDQFGSPEMPYRRDLHVIYRDNQVYLNTGLMWHPDRWTPVPRKPSDPDAPDPDVSFFDPSYFTGRTTDDPPEG